MELENATVIDFGDVELLAIKNYIWDIIMRLSL